MRIGYARVSTRDQNPEAQRDALLVAGCDPARVYIDKASGKLARRTELDKALLVLRQGDQLVITKLDRLGRSLANLIELSAALEERGVDLVVLDQGIDTSTAVGRMFFQILGAIAEFEHSLMSERTIDGLAAARARGRTGGQKRKLGPRQVKLARAMYDEVGDDGKRLHTVADIAAEFGVTRPTIYRALDPSPSKTMAAGGVMAGAFVFGAHPAAALPITDVSYRAASYDADYTYDNLPHTETGGLEPLPTAANSTGGTAIPGRSNMLYPTISAGT
jgi:DNA invertase Pin-like site-specific DNA recombinase